MNILNLLIKEKRVAGIEVSGHVIRIAYYRPRKKNSGEARRGDVTLPEHEIALVEEPIPASLLTNGVVSDIELFGKTLKEIWIKTGIEANYVIVAIPEDKVFSRIFPFPKAVGEEALEEAVKLAIDFQLPLARSQAYVGWEKVNEPQHAVHEVLISAVPREVVHGYIEALDYAGIKVLALESHLASVARSIVVEPGTATLFTKKNPDGGVTIFILRDGSLHFSRTLPESFAKDADSLINEVERVKTAFESEKKISIVVRSLSDAQFDPKFLKYPELNDYTPELRAKWLIAVGALNRGEIPEGQDVHISLLPVGTAEAYAFQKTTTVITLMRNMIIGVSIFFLATFLATYFFVFYLSQAATNANSGILARPISPDMLKNEAKIKNVNALTAASQAILSTTPTWSILLEDIESRVIPGVLISSFSAASINEAIIMVGTAKDRNTLNLFKKSMLSSDYVTSVELPINNIEKKADIPFTLSFRIKDPSTLYNK